jgi:group I intron endonuclease
MKRFPTLSLLVNPNKIINWLILNKSYSTDVNSNVDNLKKSLPSFVSNAIKVFLNILSIRVEISNYLKGRSGIYCWVNLINGKYYIGSGVDLRARVNDYFQKSYYKSRSNSLIVKPILKYGLGNFALVILEFTNNEDLLSRENFYIETLKPEYNILKNASNSSGYKHTQKSIEKITKSTLGKKRSLDIRKAMSVSRMGNLNPMFGKVVSNITRAKISSTLKGTKNKPSFPVEVLDLENNQTTNYSSMREAARSIGANYSTLIRRGKNNSLKAYKGRYVITVRRS